MDYVDFIEEMRVFDADTSAVPQVGPYADILRVLIVEEFAIPTDFEFVVDDSLELGHGFEGSF